MLGGHDGEVVERGLAPAQELVALAVALVLQRAVEGERVGPAEVVGDDGVVDDQLGGRQRVDLLRVAAEVGHRLAHGGQVDDARDAGEVLHQHPRRRELDLGVRLGRRVPVGQRPHVVGGDVGAVLGAQQVLEQHLQRVREGQQHPVRRTAGRRRRTRRQRSACPWRRSCRGSCGCSFCVVVAERYVWLADGVLDEVEDAGQVPGGHAGGEAGHQAVEDQAEEVDEQGERHVRRGPRRPPAGAAAGRWWP